MRKGSRLTGARSSVRGHHERSTMNAITPQVPAPRAEDPGLADAAASIRAIGEDSPPSAPESRPSDLERGDDE
ncbi:MAG: hypothetical protein RI885_2744 [Actinomycetota bacterium]